MVLRILKMIATSGFPTALECTNFVSAVVLHRTPLGDLTALSRPLAGLRGPISKGKRGKGKNKGEEGKERPPPPFAYYWIRPCGGLFMCKCG